MEDTPKKAILIAGRKEMGITKFISLLISPEDHQHLFSFESSS